MDELLDQALRLKEGLAKLHRQTSEEWAACSHADQPEALQLRDKRARLIAAANHAEKRFQRRLSKI